MSIKHMSPRAAANRETGTGKTDAEVKAILTEAMADSGATPAAVYAFHKTGVILTQENESLLSPERLQAWSDAIEEYEALANRSNIVV